MAGSGNDQGDITHTRQDECVALPSVSSDFSMSHLWHNIYPYQLLESLREGQTTFITHLVPTTSGDVYAPTLALKVYYLSLLLSPTSRILDLEVAIRDGAVTKIGKFADIYQGKVLTKSSDILVPGLMAVKLLRLNLDNEVVIQLAEVGRHVWSHPNICPFWSLESAAGAKPAIAMPWFNRGNILDWSLQNPALDKLIVVRELAAAISYLHAADVVHGNITPSNIMVTDGGRACLTDVGLHAQLSKLTYSGAWHVPPGWMYKAPEELLPQCDPLSFVPTKAMDVYAFASVAYTIFASKPPFNEQAYARGLTQILSCGHVLEKPVEVTDTLWDLLRRCWAPLPQDRPAMATVEVELVVM